MDFFKLFFEVTTRCPFLSNVFIWRILRDCVFGRHDMMESGLWSFIDLSSNSDFNFEISGGRYYVGHMFHGALSVAHKQ